MAERVTIDLKKPIMFGDVTVTKLTFRPLKAKDLRRLKSSMDQPMALTLELAGYLSGQVTQVIDELEGEDLQEVLKVVGDFFGGTPKTGPTPSEP